MCEQLLLFCDSEEEQLRREVDRLRDQCDRLRKSLHAKHGRLEKMLEENRHELESIKRAICLGQKIEYQGFL